MRPEPRKLGKRYVTSLHQRNAESFMVGKPAIDCPGARFVVDFYEGTSDTMGTIRCPPTRSAAEAA